MDISNSLEVQQPGARENIFQASNIPRRRKSPFEWTAINEV